MRLQSNVTRQGLKTAKTKYLTDHDLYIKNYAYVNQEFTSCVMRYGYK